MNNDVLGTGTPINKNDLNKLAKETKENNAFDAKNENNQRSFTAAELWDMQRRQRTATSMRRSFL